MVLVDVNLLVYAVFEDSPRHVQARLWLDGLLGGSEPVALPWAVLTSFVRISTNPRVMTEPLTLEEALAYMDEWLALPIVRTPGPTTAHGAWFSQMLRGAQALGNLVSDAHLAALAGEYNCTLASTDSDFAKFPGLRWIDPLTTVPPSQAGS
jgi:toxin-antitoxin system PIN domain toxin